MILKLDGLLPFFQKFCKVLFQVSHESFVFGLLSQFFQVISVCRRVV